MTTESLETYDHQPLGGDRRRGVCHISDVLPVVLARIAAMAQSDTDRPRKPVDAALHMMPMSSTSHPRRYA